MSRSEWVKLTDDADTTGSEDSTGAIQQAANLAAAQQSYVFRAEYVVSPPDAERQDEDSKEAVVRTIRRDT